MKTLQLKILFALLAAASFSGCKKNVSINEKQAILFQVDFVNYAWGYQHRGILVDNQGIVLVYKNPQNWNFPDKDMNLTDAQVRENIENCLSSGVKIPAEELRKYAGYIKNLSSSKVSASKNVAADAGSTQYICYQFSEKAGSYKGCLIKMEGDFTSENLNFFTKKVAVWLKNLNETAEKK